MIAVLDARKRERPPAPPLMNPERLAFLAALLKMSMPPEKTSRLHRGLHHLAATRRRNASTPTRARPKSATVEPLSGTVPLAAEKENRAGRPAPGL